MTNNDDTVTTASLVDLPDAVDGDFDVYVNGILQQPGTDYQSDGRILTFNRSLTPEIRMSKLQVLRAALGMAGTYKSQDTIDITYHRDGRNLVATGLRPRDTNSQRPAH